LQTLHGCFGDADDDDDDDDDNDSIIIATMAGMAPPPFVAGKFIMMLCLFPNIFFRAAWM
jgi:hypothetical protein